MSCQLFFPHLSNFKSGLYVVRHTRKTERVNELREYLRMKTKKSGEIFVIIRAVR